MHGVLLGLKKIFFLVCSLVQMWFENCFSSLESPVTGITSKKIHNKVLANLWSCRVYQCRQINIRFVLDHGCWSVQPVQIILLTCAWLPSGLFSFISLQKVMGVWRQFMGSVYSEPLVVAACSSFLSLLKTNYIDGLWEKMDKRTGYFGSLNNSCFPSIMTLLCEEFSTRNMLLWWQPALKSILWFTYVWSELNSNPDSSGKLWIFSCICSLHFQKCQI